MPKFTLTVEGKSNDPLTVAEPQLKLNHLVWNGDSPPDIIVLPSGKILIKIGKYLSPGDEYSYRVATMAKFVEGQLQQVMAV